MADDRGPIDVVTDELLAHIARLDIEGLGP